MLHERIKQHDAELLRKASRLHYTEAGLAYEYAQQAIQPEVKQEIEHISSKLYRRYEYIRYEN